MGNDGSKKAQIQADASVKIANINAQNQLRLQTEQRRIQALKNEEAKTRRAYELKVEQEKWAAENARKAADNAHRERIKQMEIIREQKNKQRKLDQKNAAIKDVNNKLKLYKGYLDVSTKDLKIAENKYSKISADLDGLIENIKQFPGKKKIAIEQFKTDEHYYEIKTQFDRNDKEVQSAIERTAVHESHIGQFLVLTHALTRATFQNSAQNNKMVVDIDTFRQIIERNCQSKLTIEQYFSENGLTRLIPILNGEDLLDMNDIKCDPNDEQEYQELLEMAEEGVKELYEKKPKLTFREKNRFKKCCLKPETWEDIQKEKIAAVKTSLNEISKPLSKFFGYLNIKVRDAQNILAYSAILNNTQINALKNVDKMSKQKAIEHKKIIDNDNNNNNNNSVDEVDDDIKVDNNDSKMDDNNDDIWDDISKNINDNDDEMDEMDEINDNNNNNNNNNNSKDSDFESKQLDIIFEKNKVAKQCLSLNKAAVLTIDVVENMMKDFDPDNAAQQRALSFAQSMQFNCIELIQSQGQVRQSVIIAEGILKLKPSNIESEKAQKLWKAVDEGIVNIYKNALNMTKISANFFAYFIKFKQAFLWYLSNKDKRLMISLEHLRKDIKSFKKFSLELDKTIKELDNEAMKCITSCVEQAIGAEQFDTVKRERELTYKKYLSVLQKVNAKENEWSVKYDELLDKKVDLEGKKQQYKSQKDIAENEIKTYQSITQSLHNELSKLNDIVI